MGSEVARIRESIAASYMAAQWGLSGLAYGMAQHHFITTRMERMEDGHKQLQALVGDQAMALVVETLDALPEKPTRQYIQQILRNELGATEETAHLLDWIVEMWETIDKLINRFGETDAYKIMHAPSFLRKSDVSS